MIRKEAGGGPMSRDVVHADDPFARPGAGQEPGVNARLCDLPRLIVGQARMDEHRQAVAGVVPPCYRRVAAADDLPHADDEPAERGLWILLQRQAARCLKNGFLAGRLLRKLGGQVLLEPRTLEELGQVGRNGAEEPESTRVEVTCQG